MIKRKRKNTNTKGAAFQSPSCGLSVILHNVRSAYNVGSIFRTADAVGTTKIYLCGITPTPKLNHKPASPAGGSRIMNHGGEDKIAKTALGAEKSVPWEYSGQTWQLLKKLKKQGLRIVALEQTPESKNLFTYRPKFPLALVLGHERNGLSAKILEYVDDIIEIPMQGKKESLNVAIAFGVAAYFIKFTQLKK